LKRFGRYPSALAGEVIGADGETWGNINSALYRGDRGFRGGETLAAFLRRTVGKTRRMYKPLLYVDQIIVWACRHFSRTGRWPYVTSGPVVGERGERWNAIDMALRNGMRGLPGGSSLRQLLRKVVGPSIKLKKSPYTLHQIVEWAKEHKKRTGLWPVARSGPIHAAPGETWYAVQAALQLGQRGLTGGDTLSRLLQRHVGKKPGKQALRLSQAQILKWADAYHRKLHRWPHAKSGPIDGGGGLTWQRVDTALRAGSRDLPKRQSLARLLLSKRGASAKTHAVLHVNQILNWADAYHRRCDRWPTSRIPLDATLPCSWGASDRALRAGRVGSAPAGTTLAKLLNVHRGAPLRPPKPEPFCAGVDEVLAWADRHHRRTGGWPKAASLQSDGATNGVSWYRIDRALKKGTCGLPKAGGLAQFLVKYRGVRFKRYLPPLLSGDILAWADAFHERVGVWPGIHSGPIREAPGETWTTINYALKHGTRGLPGGETLPGLLARKRGLRRTWYKPKLTVQQVLTWAVTHHREKGRWPSRRAGRISAAPDETWEAVNDALRGGYRGLPKGRSLTRVLDTIRGASGDLTRKRALKLPDVILWAKAHYRRTGEWPGKYDGRVADAKGETWFEIDEALREGLRGLPKSSLDQLAKSLKKPRAFRLKYVGRSSLRIV